MKTHFRNAAFILLFFITSCSSSKTTPETMNEVTHKVESRDFTVGVNYAHPLRMRPVYLTYGYDLRLKNDSAFAYLPYFGVAHIAPSNSKDGGIKFAGLMIGYSVIPNKKVNGWNIRFKVKTDEFEYTIFMNVFNNGNATITVSSFDRDDITFDGEVK